MLKPLNRHSTLLLLALASTGLIYWQGLHGPFIFDDAWNFGVLRAWHEGRANWQEVLHQFPSLVTSRPLAMTTFMLNVKAFGMASFGFKLGNLLIHLASGLAIWKLVQACLRRDPTQAAYANLLATACAAVWLLHPIQTSTVLYAVQRMAQLSSLFVILALWTYCIGRSRLEEGRRRAGIWLLFVVLPICVALGVLSKQNAAVAPLMCLVLEAAYFRDGLRNRPVVAFFLIFLVIPALAVLIALAIKPQLLLGGYAEWDFTLGQRLLSQPRALVGYIEQLLIPKSSSMGLYTDDFVVSTGLLTPWTTLPSILALACASAMAGLYRKAYPSVFAGWFLFLAGHSVESSFLPIEMYYEHRNYLPSFGLFLAALSLASQIIRSGRITPSKRVLFTAAPLAALLLVLGTATLGRTLIWKNKESITAQAERYHPRSNRLAFDITADALADGDFKTAYASMRRLAAAPDSRTQALGLMGVAAINCWYKKPGDNPALLWRAANMHLPRLTTYDAQGIQKVEMGSTVGNCGAPLAQIIAPLQAMVDTASALQPDTATPMWFSRYLLAQMYARDGNVKNASREAQRAWEGSRDQKTGVLLAHLMLKNKDYTTAQDLIAKLGQRIPGYDIEGQKALADLKEQMTQAQASPPSAPTDASVAR